MSDPFYRYSSQPYAQPSLPTTRAKPYYPAQLSGYQHENPSLQGPNYRWWIPAEGISREVIAADIQRYLGPDALIKPGDGVGENEVLPFTPIEAFDQH